MKIPIVKIKHYRGGENNPGVWLDGFSGLNITTSLKNNKDTFSFYIQNNRVYENGIWRYTKSKAFTQKDLVKIYGYYLDEFSGDIEDHLLMVGNIDQIDYDIDKTKALFKIIGSNSTDSALNIFSPALFSGQTATTVDQMIIKIVEDANVFSGITNSKKLKASLATLDIDGNRIGGGYIWSTKTNGDKFPIKTYVKNYTNLYRHFKTLSSQEYTEDDNGSFIYYVDINNELHFEPRPSIRKYTFSEHIDNYAILKKQITTDGMINVVLYNGGPDSNGNGTLALSIATDSVQKYGAKYKYISDDKISSQVFNKENTVPDGGDNNGSNYIKEDTMYPNSYPWYARQNVKYYDDVYYVGSQLNTAEEFNNYIRTALKGFGKNRSMDIKNKASKPRNTIKLEPELGTTMYNVGDKIEFIYNSIDFNKKLTVQQIMHSFDDIWRTEIELKEDVEDAV